MLLASGRFKTDWVRWSEAFSLEDIRRIKEIKNDFDLEEATVGGEDSFSVNEHIRKSKVFFVNRENKYSWIFQRLDYIANSANNDFFGFDLYHTESFQYTLYTEDNKGFYRWHWDTNTGNNIMAKQRKVSMVIQLSDPSEYEGGNLCLCPAGREIVVEKELGLGAIFPSFVNHTVTPVTSGVRETLVCWVTGPEWR